MTKPRAAFSLTELMVSLAILGTLVSVLMPAVQSAREAARRSQCANHLRQVGYAAHSFHTAHGCFPPGYLGPGRPIEVWPPLEYQFVGHLPYLLPRLELEAISDRIETDLDVDRHGTSWWEDDATYRIAQARLAVLRCPSAPRTQNGAILLVHYYFEPGWVWAIALTRDEPADALLGVTEYLGCAGAWGVTGTDWDDYRGVFTDRSLTRYKQILDGTSRTFLFGETLGWRGEDDFPYAWMGGGPLQVAGGLGVDALHFDSDHPHVVQFCYADGSVRTLSKQTNAEVVLALGGIADGDVNGDQVNDE